MLLILTLLSQLTCIYFSQIVILKIKYRNHGEFKIIFSLFLISVNYVCKYRFMPSSNWSWTSLSPYIKNVRKLILTHQLGPNGTAIEGDWEDVFKCVKKFHEKIHQKGAPRIYSTFKLNTKLTNDKKFKDEINSVLDNEINLSKKQIDRLKIWHQGTTE